MTADFWKDRKVFITGHTGFKGSWLCLWLQRLGANVLGYSLPPPTKPSHYDVADVGAGMHSVVGDVRDYAKLKQALDEHAPEVVFHMAAQSVVRQSYEDPIDTYSTNVIGTVNVFEALRHVPGRMAIVNVTSDKSYQNNEWIWGYRETDRLGGHDPYSNSKACAELVTQSFRDSFFSAKAGGAREKFIAVARAGNVIGGGDWTRDQLIPDVFTAFREGRPVVLRDPRAIRPWQHMLDCLSGYMTVAEKLLQEGERYTGAWNIGPRLEDTVPVQRIVERLIKKWPDQASWVRDGGSHPHEAGCLRLDTSKASLELGWRPRLVLDDALDWTAEWYARYFRGEGAKIISLEHIERYANKVTVF